MIRDLNCAHSESALLPLHHLLKCSLSESQNYCYSHKLGNLRALPALAALLTSTVGVNLTLALRKERN
jgi:hypothetical protein